MGYSAAFYMAWLTGSGRCFRKITGDVRRNSSVITPKVECQRIMSGRISHVEGGKRRQGSLFVKGWQGLHMGNSVLYKHLKIE